MKTRLIPAVLTATVLGLSLTACGGDDSGSDTAGSTLTVCSDVPYAPFEDFDKSSSTGFKGFDVDIVTYIGKGLDRPLTIKDSSFDALQSGLALNSGQCDLVASAMTITDDRKKNLDFSDGYYDSKQSLLVPSDSDITNIAGLAGKKVGVQQGTTGKAYAEENASDAQIVTFPSDAEMFQALKAGQVDALLQDLPVNLNHTTGGDFKVVETYSTNEQYGLAMKKGDTTLVDEVNKQLKKMHDDGTYDKLYNQYFSTN